MGALTSCAIHPLALHANQSPQLRLRPTNRRVRCITEPSWGWQQVSKDAQSQATSQQPGAVAEERLCELRSPGAVTMEVAKQECAVLYLAGLSLYTTVLFFLLNLYLLPAALAVLAPGAPYCTYR